MGAQSHGWVIAHLLDTQNQSYLWKAGSFVVLVQIRKPILLMPYDWKLFCRGLGTLKPVTRQPNRVMSTHVPSLQADLGLTVK